MSRPAFLTLNTPGGAPTTFLRHGVEYSRQVVVVPALFTEGEKTRALATAIMRALAARGCGTVLVELPGLGESEVALPVSLDPWREAVRTVATMIGATHAITIRGGALLDGAIPDAQRYRLTPVPGAALVRDLVRAAAIERAENGGLADRASIEAEARGAGARLAGYAIPGGLFGALETAAPDEGGRVARLAGDARPADVRLDGPLLWRQSEPDSAIALANAIADDFSAWAEA